MQLNEIDLWMIQGTAAMNKISKKTDGIHGKILKKINLDGNFAAFLKMNACFTGFFTIMSLFINTFLLKDSMNMDRVMIYNMILVSVQPFSMVGTVFVVRHTSPGVSQRIGLSIYGLVFILLAIFGENAAGYYWAIAILLSVAAGFFYVTYALQIVSYTNDSNRDTTSGMISLIGSLIAFIIPLVSGFVLSLSKGFTGYRILFVLMLLLVLQAAVFTTKLAPLGEFDHDKQTHFKEVLKALLRNKTGQKVMAITAIGGVRDGTMAFFISILIYQFIKNEMLIGVNSSLGSIAAIVSASLYGLLIKPSKRSRSVYLSVTLVVIATAFLYFKLDPTVLIAFNVVNSLLGTFIIMPQTNVYYAILQSLDSIRGKGAEVHTVREFFYGAGRVSGIVLTMLLPGSAAGSVTAIMMLAASQYLSAWLIYRIQKQLNS